MEDGVDITFIYFMKMLEKGESLKHRTDLLISTSHHSDCEREAGPSLESCPEVKVLLVHKALYCLGYTSKPVNINCKQKVVIC